MQYCIKRFKKKKVGAISTYGLWEPPCRDSLLHTPLVLSSALTVCLVETPTCCGHQPFMLMLTWIPLPSPLLIHFDSQIIQDFGLWMKNYSRFKCWALLFLLLHSNRGADLDPKCKNTPNLLLTCCQHELKSCFIQIYLALKFLQRVTLLTLGSNFQTVLFPLIQSGILWLQNCIAQSQH